MFYRYVIVAQVCFLIFGVWWCKDVFGRFRRDIAILKEAKERSDKVLVVFWWVVTLGIILVMAAILWNMISRAF
ncbi:MAG: hypothetical protein O7H41_11800 [Planctomycetota bacterium]|nr:hypothetical protein [Planctomycetota bacterium]